MAGMIKLELTRDACKLNLEQIGACDAESLLGSVFATILFRFVGESSLAFSVVQSQQRKLVELEMTLGTCLSELAKQIHAAPSSAAPMTRNIPSLVIVEGSADPDVSSFNSDLVLTVRINAGNVDSVAIYYSANAHSAFLASNMLDSWETAINSLSEESDSQVCELGLLSAVQSEMLEDWNQTREEFPRNEVLHELFEAQVKSNGLQCAVLDPDQAMLELTYFDLERQAVRVYLSIYIIC
jgi:hypothetical protein